MIQCPDKSILFIWQPALYYYSLNKWLMRYLPYLLGILFSVFIADASQAQTAQASNIRFGKVDRLGLIITYPYPKAITEAALKGRLESAGLGRNKTDKGFMSYQAVKWGEVAPSQLDVYAKVDAGKDNQSTIILLVSKGYDNYVSEASDSIIFGKLRDFLQGLLPDIKATQLLADIGVQEEAIKKAEREYRAADENGNKLTREKEKLEKQLAENAAEKTARAEALSAARARLEQMRAGMK